MEGRSARAVDATTCRPAGQRVSDDPSGPASNDDVRQLEARVDARFQAVNARITVIDDWFATLGDRLNEIDQQLQALA